MNVTLLGFTIDAGFRPGSRAPFLSGKGPKTIDAPLGYIRLVGRKSAGRRANSLRSDKVRRWIRASHHWADQQASDIEKKSLEIIWNSFKGQIKGEKRSRG